MMHLNNKQVNFFSKKNNEGQIKFLQRKDFEYLPENTVYLDAACQTLRPQPVIDAMNNYFYKYNACGGRVKYQWGKRVDEEVEMTREKVLDYAGKSARDYVAAFTLNTTYGLNLLLQQLPANTYKKIVTSEIEHNSVLLPLMVLEKRLGIPKKILSRHEDGSLLYEKDDLLGAIVVVNATSNIDGRVLRNAKVLAADVHAAGGILIVDGAQSMVDNIKLVRDIDFDALCFSAHKMYAPSLGVMVVKKQLVDSLEFSFVGGGMVESLTEHSFVFPKDDASSKLEMGLQDFAGIISLGSSIDWLRSYKPEGLGQIEQKEKLTQIAYEGILSLPKLHLVNTTPSSTISFYSEDIDAHRLATFLSEQNIMTRSGYFCCHYYLQNVKQLPPLLRVSFGLHNTESDVRKFLEVLKKIIINIQ